LAKKRIGILTGGGDVSGLNSVLKTVTYRGSDNGIDIIGLRRGWEGLTHLDCNDPASRRRYIMPLDRENTRTIDRRAEPRAAPIRRTKLDGGDVLAVLLLGYSISDRTMVV
jgi:hypothetical protein